MTVNEVAEIIVENYSKTMYVGRNVVQITHLLSRISEISSEKQGGWMQFMQVKQMRRGQHTRFRLESKTAENLWGYYAKSSKVQKEAATLQEMRFNLFY